MTPRKPRVTVEGARPQPMTKTSAGSRVASSSRALLVSAFGVGAFGVGGFLTACGGTPVSTHVDLPGGPAPTAPPAFPPLGTFATAGLADFGGVVPLPSDDAERLLGPSWSPGASGSPSLACTAREYAVRFAADRVDPGPGTVAALSEHCGLWAPPPNVFAFTAPDLAAARRKLEEAPVEERQRPCALGAVTHPNGAVSVAIATPPLGVELDPLPRRGAAQTTAKLTGRAVGGEGALWLYSMSGDRDVVAQPLVAGPGGRFEADVVFPPLDAKSSYEIVRAEGPFLRSLGVVHLQSGPLAEGYPAPPMPLANAGRDALDSALLGAVNVQRKAVGRSPLSPLAPGPAVLDPWLETVARGTATTGPGGLVDERGWPFVRLRYAFAAGVTVGEAMAALGETPLGHAALLRPEDTAMAFGLRPFGGQPGHDVVVVALERFQAPEPADVRNAVLAAANGRRKLPGLNALAASPALDAVAQQLAEDTLAGHVVWDHLIHAAGAALMKREVAVSAFGAGGFGQARLDAGVVAEDPSILHKEMRTLGVGVAAGPMAGQGQPQIVVVYLTSDAVPAAVTVPKP